MSSSLRILISVYFKIPLEMHEEHSEDKWRRVPLGLNKVSPTRSPSSDLSKNEWNIPPIDLNEISPIAPRSSRGGNLNDSFIDKCKLYLLFILMKSTSFELPQTHFNRIYQCK